MDPKDLKAQQAVASSQQQMGRPQITPQVLKNSQNISCDCGGMIFSEKLFFKKISSILSPSGKEEIAPMPIIVCEACGLVPTAFDSQNILPDSIRATTPETTQSEVEGEPDGDS